MEQGTEFTKRLDAAFYDLRKLGLTTIHQAWALGFTNVLYRRELKRLLLGVRETPELTERMRHIAIIVEAGLKHFGSQRQLQDWAKSPNGQLDGKTPKELLISGNLGRLRRVARVAIR